MQLRNIQDQPPAYLLGLLFVTLAPLYYASYRHHVSHPYGGAINRNHERPTPVDFVREWLDVQVVSPFNPAPVAHYCKGIEWKPDLIFKLDNANGGIGDVRGNVLDFLFYAIEGGASIILPGMAVRHKEDLHNVWGSRASFNAFFDEEWFIHAIGTACPQMKVYQPQERSQLATPLPGNYVPRSRRLDEDQGNTRKAYIEHLNNWLKEKSEFHADNQTVVSLERTLWEVDTRSLPRGFRRNWGQLLRVEQTVRKMAGLVVQNIAARYDIPFDPREVVPRKAFYGAHLRTMHEPYLNFSAQTDAYIATALKHKLKIIYAAIDNETDLNAFKQKAQAHIPPLSVTSKFDLLPQREIDSLRSLSPDQQALVDYEVLQRCSVFGGITKSSFSYNIAMTRNQWLEDSGRVMEPWRVVNEEDGVAFDDGISRLLGHDEFHEKRVPRGMWP